MELNRIVCAATLYECVDKIDDELFSFVIPSVRHYDTIHRDIACYIDDYSMDCVVKEEQGFLDKNGKFHDRRAALKIAKEANQLIRKTPPEDRLFSEDLY